MKGLIIAAAIVMGGSSLALAQGGGGGAGGELSTPRKNVTRPTPNSPPVNRRGDDMAPGMNSMPMGNQGAMNSNGMGMKAHRHKRMAHRKSNKRAM